MENNVKIEIEIGGVENLDTALMVSKLVFEPTKEEEEKYHNLEDWKNKIENGGVLVVGKVDGKIAGFIIAYKTADEVMHVWNAGVLAECRKLGIFSNMFEELAVKCRQDGIKKMTLNTIEKKFPEMYKYAINKGFVEYEKEWVEDYKVGRAEKSKFELAL
jgi:N-acetylglutamate synthase-like GNAT family acetyltransferase